MQKVLLFIWRCRLMGLIRMMFGSLPLVVFWACSVKPGIGLVIFATPSEIFKRTTERKIAKWLPTLPLFSICLTGLRATQSVPHCSPPFCALNLFGSTEAMEADCEAPCCTVYLHALCCFFWPEKSQLWSVASWQKLNGSRSQLDTCCKVKHLKKAVQQWDCASHFTIKKKYLF